MSFNKYVATGLTMALVASGCGRQGEFRVGTNRWVEVNSEIVQHYTNDDITLYPGDECVIERGARLVLTNAGVLYRDEHALGTECPDGAQINLSPNDVEEQDRAYKEFDARRQEVTRQVKDIIGNRDVKDIEKLDSVKATGKWVDIVNPDPINQQYVNGIVKLEYGDTCITEGQSAAIGTLTTGETVMYHINPGARGTPCPTGAIYLEN